jgi:hypothetical protein
LLNKLFWMAAALILLAGVVGAGFILLGRRR